MKSTSQQLSNRGFIAESFEQNFQALSFEQCIALLKSKLPTERTLGARLLAKNNDLSAINYLADALKTEKKLYTKLEICNSLVSYGKDAVEPLIGLLGTAGNNQHRVTSGEKFKKDNYPLPRDIAARVLIRIGVIALPDVLKVLDSNEDSKLSEVIDVIGFICFYDYQPSIFQLLESCFYRNGMSDLIKWKIFRAMSAFPESEFFLKEQQRQAGNEALCTEIERSLALIRKRGINNR